MRALDPDRYQEWIGIVPQLLVRLVHGQELMQWMWADESSRGPAPTPIPMPWEVAEQRSADEDLVAQLRANET